ncbi:hypothetical protein Leryth_006863 [Lithospermum erythrorhizon]|nr:hypothetical protein Leryth_006863 [Lithospermum erythrorhizon]
MLATTLHAMSMLLRAEDKSRSKWDWFINLSASDYPLVTQDGMLAKDLNFVQHSNHLGWKMNKRAKPIVIDPGLHSVNKSELWWVVKQRSLPTAFKLFTGSAWTVLSRSFSEYCILGWDNLPRTLLLYYTNFVSTRKVIFKQPMSWVKDYRRMVLSNRPFKKNDPVLDKIDRGLLKRRPGQFAREMAVTHAPVCRVKNMVFCSLEQEPED